MIVSDTFWDWVKYETDAAAIADVCKVLAGVKDAEDLDGHARVMAMTFRDHTAATVSAIETKRANWKREKAKARELSNGQENCPTDKNDVRTIQSTNQSTNQPINQPINQSILPVGKPPGNARAQARPRASSAPPVPPGNIPVFPSAPPSSGPPDEISSIFAEAARRMRNRDEPESQLRVDYGTIFSDADPVLLALSLTNTGRKEDRKAFGALLKAVGEKRFRDTLATMFGEMNAGEVPDNPVGALIAKLRAVERNEKERKQ